MINSFQRIGSKSNAQVGDYFETDAMNYFLKIEGINTKKVFPLQIGIGELKKLHRFDLGSEKNKVIIECKSHTWTSGKNVPSAKLTVWNEAMYYFACAPNDFRKILFVLRDYNEKRKETLAEYYIRTYKHLIPNGVEILEYNHLSKTAKTFSTDSI